jgi:hypothetical protein
VKKGQFYRFVFAGLLIGLFFPLQGKALRGQAYYHNSADRLFWFMIISDSHIGADGSQDTEFLTWAVTEARNILKPHFIVNSGDLTDSTNGGTIPNGPYEEEWVKYRQILIDAGVTADIYFDIPGNHDAYNDENFAFYKAYSMQGNARNTTQHSWLKSFEFGSYQFLGICTAGNDGASFSIWPWDNFGDHAGLDQDELAFIESQLTANPLAELVLIFGHHPFEAGYDDWTDTGLSYGLDDFLNLVDLHAVSLYQFGHTHDYNENIYSAGLSGGIFYLNVDSLGKSNNDHYAVMAVDGNGISIVPGQKGEWPLVLITAPMDRCLGRCPNGYAYDIPSGHANPIRALVFDKSPVSQVEFRIDQTGDWHPMQPVDSTPVWFGLWDARLYSPGSHTIEVRAQGSAAATDMVTAYLNPELYLEDSDEDGIVDVLEDANHNGVVDEGETDPYDPDTDDDGLQDGTELGVALQDVGAGTDLNYFQPDLDPATTTDPLDDDSDADGRNDGDEDRNRNGRVDAGETDPNHFDSTALPWLPLLLLDEQVDVDQDLSRSK